MKKKKKDKPERQEFNYCDSIVVFRKLVGRQSHTEILVIPVAPSGETTARGGLQRPPAGTLAS